MKKYIKYILLLISLSLCAWSLLMLCQKIRDYDTGEDYYEFISDIISEDVPLLPMVPDKSGKGGEAEEPCPDDERIPEMKKINREELIDINSDYVAWVDFGEEVDIDYPIVQSPDDYYLKYNFEKKKNSNGCLLIDSKNDATFHDLNTVVWGHNMKSKAMFGKLNEYRKEEYYKKHPYFWIYTEEESLLYKIISVHDVTIETPALRLFKDTLNAEDFYEAVHAKKKYETESITTPYKTIVTLATCDGNYATRFLVHGQLVWKKSLKKRPEQLQNKEGCKLISPCG